MTVKARPRRQWWIDLPDSRNFAERMTAPNGSAVMLSHPLVHKSFTIYEYICVSVLLPALPSQTGLLIHV